MNENKKSSLFSNLWLVLIILFIYLPIIYVVLFSFNDSKSLTTFTGFSYKWYEKMFANRSMLEAIYYTVLISVLATVISTVIGTITAIGLSKQNKIVRNIILQINNLPVMNPDIVTAIGLMLFFISINITTSFWTLLLAHITFCIPYVILTIMPKLRMLDDNVAEAALDLGATPVQALTKVIIPQIMPAIISGALIAFSMSFDDFVISFFTTGNGVSNISIYVYSMSKRINPTINALSAIIVLVATTVLVLTNVIPMIREKRNKDAVVKKFSYKPVIAVAVALCIFLVSSFFKQSEGFDPIEAFGTDTLYVFNAGEYVGEECIGIFEEMYNVRVRYETFASNEEMYVKLQSGTAYDVVIPSDYMIEKLMKEDRLQKIDKSIVTNLDMLAEGVQSPDFDPDHDYAVPYMWGSVGICYDETLVDSEDVESEGWEIFRDEKYKGMSYMYDSERDAFMIAFKALGYSMNTNNMDEIEEAYQWLLDMDNKLEPSYVTDESIDGLINGEKAMGLMYSGDAAYIISENENMRYYEPEEGTNIWIDAMVIPKNAKCPKLANVFINYMLDYDAAYDNSYTIGYTSNNQEVMDFLSSEEGDYFENEAYLPRVGYEFDESYNDNEVLRKAIAERWVKVKIN